MEAQNAISRKDFSHKVFISKKEAQETLYWLKLLNDTNTNRNDIEILGNLIDECQQIIKILQVICSKAKQPVSS